MQIAGYSSKVVLDSMKTLASKKLGEIFTEKEIMFFDSVEAWHNSVELCAHTKCNRVERILSNGSTVNYTQCQHCGWGKAIKKEKPEPTESWEGNSQDIRNLVFKVSGLMNPLDGAFQMDDFDKQRKTKSKDFWEKWEAHIGSDAWRATRRKVIARAGGICEGCLDAPIQEVHHKNYNHLGDEFCFELIGLCSKCHSRFHNKGEL